MAKIKNPLLALGAIGNIAKGITFARRRKTNIAEAYPLPKDAKSPAQLSWRHMYQKAVALWHALSDAEKQEWESLARPKHMTGFAWFISQALKPNPGLYLPLQGGTMSGDIDMAKNRLLKLPLPTDSQEAASKAYIDAEIAFHASIAAAHHTNLATITFIIDGGGSAITIGDKGHLEIPFACEISQVTMLADQTGSIKVDIWKDTYALFPPTDGDTICGANEPEITDGIKDQDATLTAWTKSIAVGDILAFNVDSCTDIERVTISLKVIKS